ncbi:MAG: polysaccharide deacetylase family protein [Anaerolineae bacterium]|nr:polysaccharide deacetylase family protein [Anaerolineae bacterium]
MLAKLGLMVFKEEFYVRLNPTKRIHYRQAEEKYQDYFGELDVFKSILQRDLSPEADKILSRMFMEIIGQEESTAQNFYLNLDQIAEMSAGGMHFGGHSHTHPWLDFVSPEIQSNEIHASMLSLQTVEPGPWAFAYPYGGLSHTLPPILRSHQFSAAFTTKSRTHHTDPFLIGRLDGEEVALQESDFSLAGGAG